MFVVKHKTVVSHVEQLTARTWGLAVAQTCYMGGKEKGEEERNERCRFRYNVFISAVHLTDDYGGPKVASTGEIQK